MPAVTTRTQITVCSLIIAMSITNPSRAQSGGDQIIDGIGETALIARYVLDGSIADSSRNNFGGEFVGAETAFSQGRRFGRALSLSGDSGIALKLPPTILTNVDAVTVAAWVQLRSDLPDQALFCFERGSGTSFTCSLVGAEAKIGLAATVTTTTCGQRREVSGPAVSDARWHHVAVVLSSADKSLVLFLDGAAVDIASDVSVDVEKLFGVNDIDSATLRVGVGMKGLLHDLRFYSVALTPEQVATIYQNAAGRQSSQRPPEAVTPVPTTLPVRLDFGGLALENVLNITVTTPVGQLPKLPSELQGKYASGSKGPALRVIWPASRDAAAVLQPGSYTITGRIPGTDFAPKATITVVAQSAATPLPQRALRPFGLGDVTLDRDLMGRDTPYIRNRDKFLKTLVRTNPDDFLYMFRDAFGQPQPEGAKPLGVWDNQTTRLRGHATGHYLSAIAQAYASSRYDAELQKNLAAKMNRMIDTLYELSQKSGNPREPNSSFNADPTKVPPGPSRNGYDSDLSVEKIRTDYWNWGRGYISAYPPDQFIMLEKGATYGTSNEQIWAPYYTLHKIIAGLLDCYEVGGNQKALDIARGMGMWTFERLKLLPRETRIAMWNRYIAGEYGGMNEVMARLGRLSGDERFIECAKLFDNIEFFYGNMDHTAGLARNVDTLRGKHANQHIPQIMGALEMYGQTHAPDYFHVADNFWDIITTSYTYSIGGVAGARTPNNAECFTVEPDTLWQNGFAEGGQNETCATYNMLKLSRLLFQYDPSAAKYMNYYERAMLNDILASVAEDSAANTYHIPLNPGTRKSFSNADMDGFTCCNGTALESNTKMQDTIYFRSEDQSALYVNLFIPSTLNWSERKTTVKQETSFPYSDSTRLIISKGGDFKLLVRVPDWATQGFFVTVNGSSVTIDGKPNTYAELGRSWKDGDSIDVRIPFAFHLARVMDQPNVASLLYGPVVLAAEEPGPRSDWRKLVLDPENMSKSITGDPMTLRFKIGDVTLKPFFESYGRYSVYFDVAAK